MNIEEFKNSITNGDLIIEDVKAHLASLETPAAEATPAPSSPVATLEEGPDLAKLVQDAVNAALVPQQEALRVANEKIAELEKLPGASRSNPPIPTEKLPEGVTDGAAYAEYLEGVKQFENTNETFSY